MARNKTPQSMQDSTWGPALGLLAGCGVTLIGVSLNLPPMTILVRSVVSGAIVAAMVALFSFGWSLVTPPREEE